RDDERRNAGDCGDLRNYSGAFGPQNAEVVSLSGGSKEGGGGAAGLRLVCPPRLRLAAFGLSSIRAVARDTTRCLRHRHGRSCQRRLSAAEKLAAVRGTVRRHLRGELVRSCVGAS